MSLECTGLTVSVAGRSLVRALNLALDPGQFLCLLGPNGVGKTLTLHTLAGLRQPAAGTVRLHGQPMMRLARRSIARRLGLLLQSQDDAFPHTVLETALMGRFARIGLWQWERSSDVAATRAALRVMDLDGMESRLTATLSGGERQRLALATLLVQDPDVMLLDEPMNHLDPLHKLTVLARLERLAASGKTIVASLHDPTLAARFGDSVLLLHGDGNWQCGPVDQLLTTDNLQRLYGTRFARFACGDESILLPVAPLAGTAA